MAERTIAGRYVLVEQIGESSWRATDTELRRDVFVRLAPTRREPTALSHPNVARVFDQGEADGTGYVVREYLPGGSLDERLAGLGEADAVAAAADVAAALAYAHAQGVTHGALGPSCVLFDAEGRAKVVGFGADGEPADDVRAFGGILQSLASAATALAPLAAAALAGEIDSAELLQRLGRAAPVAVAEEETTLIQAPPAAPRRRLGALLVAAALALLAAGVGAAFLTTGDDSTGYEPSVSISVPTGSSESTTEEPAPPPTPESDETTTEPATEPPPTATIETQPTTSPPAASTDSPSTTEPPPPTTTEEPPPTTTETTTAPTETSG